VNLAIYAVFLRCARLARNFQHHMTPSCFVLFYLGFGALAVSRCAFCALLRSRAMPAALSSFLRDDCAAAAYLLVFTYTVLTLSPRCLRAYAYFLSARSGSLPRAPASSTHCPAKARFFTTGFFRLLPHGTCKRLHLRTGLCARWLCTFFHYSLAVAVLLNVRVGVGSATLPASLAVLWANSGYQLAPAHYAVRRPSPPPFFPFIAGWNLCAYSCTHAHRRPISMYAVPWRRTSTFVQA
jgi:hypothetical protein